MTLRPGPEGGLDDKPREVYAPRERGVEELWDGQVSTGINFEKYDHIPVKVSVWKSSVF